MKHRSKAYYKDQADRYERTCKRRNADNIRLTEELHKSMGDAFGAKSELKAMKFIGWRKRAIMQCLVGLSYDNATDLIISVQDILKTKSGEEIITYSEQS